MAITKFNVVEGLTVGDLVQIPVIDNTANVSANNLTVQGNSNLGNYATANFFVGNGSQLTGITLGNTLADVQITSPTLGQTLAYNGIVWVNTTTGSVSAGQGVDFFFTGPQIIAQTANNFFQLDSLSSSPNATASTVSQAINNTTLVITGGRSNALNRTKIDGGSWDISVYGNVNNTSGTNSLQPAILYVENPNCTFTITGTGTSRTATASAGSPFANITASATNTSSSWLETPTGVYQISAKTSNTVVTIDTPTGYTNESAVSGYVYNPYILFTAKDIISTSIAEYVFSASAVEQAIATDTRLGFFIFGTTTSSKTLYVTLGGTTQATHLTTPLATLHDELAGLQGGQASEYYHLTYNEYAGTGTGNFVRQSNANLITPNIDSAIGLSLNLTGNVIAGNANLGNLVVANYITGTLTTGSQPNITSLGNLSSLTSNGTIDFINATNVSLGNVSNLKILGGSSGYVLKTDGTGNLSWGIDTAAAGGTNTEVQFNDNNVLGGNAKFTFDKSTGLVTVTGNINALNADLGNLVAANYISANGYLLSNINGSNVTGTVANANYAAYAGNAFSVTGSNVSGQVANALIAGTVYTNAQPNITSVGTLSSLSVTANITAGNISATDAVFSGNLTVSGNTIYANVTTLNVKDPIIEMGGNPNGDPLTTNDGKDRGTLLHYYSGAAIDAFMGWDNSNSEFAFGSNVTNTNEIITFNQLGNVRANYFLGNASQLTGTIANANYSTFAGTVTTNAQPNITSLGTLSSLTINGNLSSGNANLGNLAVANFFSGDGSFLSNINVANIGTVANANYALYAGTVLTNAQPNITSVGDLSGLTVTGNITSGNANLGNLTTSNFFSGNGSLLSSITGSNVTGQVGNALIAGTVYTNSQPNITSVGTLNGLTANATIDFTNATNVSLGNVSNLKILGGSSGYVLKTDGTGNLSWGIDTAAAAGSNTQIQFNDGNSLGADSNLIYDKATQVLDVLGTVAGYVVRPSIGSGANGIVFPNNPGGGAGDGASIKYYAYSGEDSVLEFTVANDANDYIKFNSPGGVVVDNNIVANNANLGNLVNANYFSGNGSLLTSVTGANVTGQVGNALVAGTVYTNAQPNITSLGTLSSLNVTGNITSGNATLGNLTISNYFSGNGSLLSSITGANVTGTVPNANYSVFAGTVIANAQPNITSLGTLSNLNVSGNAQFTGANTYISNVANLKIPGGSNGYVLKTDGTGNLSWGIDVTDYSNTNVAAYLPTYTGNLTAGNISATGTIIGAAVTANFSMITAQTTGVFYPTFVNSNSSGNYALGSHSTLSYDAANSELQVGNLVSGTGTGGSITGANLISANFLSGNGSLLTAINGSNVTGQVGNALVAGTVFTNAQPNITSLGTLSNVTVTSNVDAGNVRTDNLLYANGTPYVFTANAAGSNTQVQFNDGNLFAGSSAFTFNKGTNTLSVTNFAVSNVTANGIANLGSISNVQITGGTAGYFITTDGLGNLSWTNGGNGGSGFVKVVKNSFVGDGSNTVFNLSTIPSGEESVMVNIDGLLQQDPVYTVSGSQITFATAPLSGVKIEVTTFGALSITQSNTQILYINGNSLGGSNNFVFDDTTNTLSVNNISSNSNVAAGNIKTDNLLYANGTPYAFSSNAAGSNTQVQFNDGNSFAGSANFTFDKSTNTLSVTNIIGNGAGITYITGSNVNGQVSNALVAGTVYTNAQPNITSLGNLSNLTVTGNADLGNLLVTGNVLGSLIPNANVTYDLGSNNYRWNDLYLSGNSIYLGDVVLTSNNNDITADGNINANNANLGNAVIANYFIGNGSLLSAINGSNVTGQVGNALIAGTVYTNSQPNITSLGNLSSLTVSGNTTIAGNLTVSGNTVYANVTTLNVKDPIIELGGTGNNDPLSSNDGKDRGTLLHYYTTSPIDAFMGWDNSNGEFGFGSNVTATNEVITWNSYGNIRANYIYGNGAFLTGLPEQYGNSNVANYLPTYTGNLSAGNITGANLISGNYLTGTLTTGNQPNITSLGTLTNVSVTGNVTAGNLTSNSLGNQQIAISLNGLLVGGPDLLWEFSNAALYAKNLKANGASIIDGNITSLNANLGNLVTANYFTGNGSLLTSITGANITGQVANATVAGTVYTNAQPNITSVGTLSSLTVTGLITATGTGIKTSNIQDSLGTITIVTRYSNVTGDVGIYGNLVVGTSGTGNITAYNASLGNLANASFFSGNGSLLSSLTGSNVTGQVGNALVAGTVYTNAQPNITSVGTLSGLTVTANISAGNLLTSAAVIGSTLVSNVSTGTAPLTVTSTTRVSNLNVSYSNVSDYANVIEQNTGNYYPVFISNYSNGNYALNVNNSFSLNANTGVFNAGGFQTGIGTGGNITGANLVSANYFQGDGSLLTNLNIGNALVANANYAAYAGNVTLAAQPNITSLGTLNSLSVTGNITAGNATLGNLATASYFSGNGSLLTSLTGGNVTGQVGNALVAGTVYTNAQPNITSLGTLTSLTISGNVTSGNANLGNAVTANYFIGDGSLLTGLPASYSNTNVAAYLPTYTGNFTASNISATGTIIGAAVTANYVMSTLQTTGVYYPTFITNSASGNYALASNANISFDVANGTLNVAKISSGTGNGGSITGANLISANYFQGDGSLLTNLNVSNASVANANYAAFAGNVTLAAQPNITSLGTLSSLTITGNVVAGNVEASSGTVKLGSGLISVSGSNAGIFTTGIGNINLGIAGNVVLGSTTGNVVVQGRIGANLFYSNRAAIVVTTNTVIDSFTTSEYRSAKYTMRVNSDNGYQTSEVLLIHDGSNSFVTIYGTLSTVGTDIITLSTDINSGNVRLLATTGTANTTVKVLGTYIAD